MQEILDILINNLEHVGIGLLLFVMSYLCNMSFSLYYNIKILEQKFEKAKLIESIIKIVTFCIGTTLLCIVITTIPAFSTYVGFEIPTEYQEVFQDLTILSVFIISSCKYVMEAYTKFKAIANEGHQVN